MTHDELLQKLGSIIAATEEELTKQKSSTGKAYLRGYLTAMDRVVGMMMEQKPDNGE